MRTMHLFAGAGGGLLADLILGHDPIIAVEWDAYCCQVLRERAEEGWFPNLRVWEGDVRLFDPSEYAGEVGCIHAGFPCQDISVAGKQAGVGEATRSGLYREALRIVCTINEIRKKSGLPRVLLYLENVSAILFNGLGSVLADLAEMGYDARWCCIPASDVGAWHWRDRWFCLASDDWSQRVQREFKKEIQGKPSLPWSEDVRRIEDLQHRPDIPDPLVRGIRNGVPNYVDRIKALGNAQVPLQAAVAWKLLGGP